MTINKTQDGKNLTIALEGRLDTMTAPELEAELNASLPEAEALTLDFSKLLNPYDLIHGLLKRYNAEQKEAGLRLV